MNCGRTAFSCAIVAALLTGCTSRPSAPASSQALDLGDFKAALIAYIDTHPGVFIGRGSAAGLKDKPLVPLAAPDSELMNAACLNPDTTETGREPGCGGGGCRGR